jgi:hypothetical protein
MYDVFNDCYAARNLDPDFYHEAKCNEPLKKLSEEIRAITEKGLVAAVPTKTLSFIDLDIAMSAAIHTSLIQVFHRGSGHWAAISLCMLYRFVMEVGDLEEGIIRFSKTESEGLPLYKENVKTEIKMGGRIHLTPKINKPEVITQTKIVLPVSETQLSLF